MTLFHQRQERALSKNQFSEAYEYAKSAGMRLSRDTVEGYWLHFDGRMRFVRYLSDVRGTVDYIETWGTP